MAAAGLSGTELLRYFSMQAAELVDEKVRSREERKVKRAAVGLTLLSLVGLSGTIALVNYTIDNQVEERFQATANQMKQENELLRAEMRDLLRQQQALLDVKLAGVEESTTRALGYQGELLKGQEVRIAALGPHLETQVQTEAARAMGSQVDHLQKNLRTEVDYQRLNTLALSLDVKDSFANTERDAVIDLLKRLKGTEVVARSDFQEVLRKIVLSFHSAGQTDQIDELDDFLGDSMVTSPAIVETLNNHYGQRVVGSRRPLSEVGPLIARHEKYLTRSGRFGNPEQEIFWELLIKVKRDEPGGIKVDSQAVEALKYLKPEDQSFFFIKLIEYSFPPLWVERPTYTSTEIARICRLFRAAYTDSLREVFSQDPDRLETIISRLAPVLRRQHVDEETVAEITRYLQDLASGTEKRLEG